MCQHDWCRGYGTRPFCRQCNVEQFTYEDVQSLIEQGILKELSVHESSEVRVFTMPKRET